MALLPFKQFLFDDKHHYQVREIIMSWPLSPPNKNIIEFFFSPQDSQQFFSMMLTCLNLVSYWYQLARGWHEQFCAQWIHCAGQNIIPYMIQRLPSHAMPTNVVITAQLLIYTYQIYFIRTEVCWMRLTSSEEEESSQG